MTPFLCTILFYLFCDKIRRYGPTLTLCWVSFADNLCFFGALTIVVLKSTSGAMNSVLPNESVVLSAKHGLLKVAPDHAKLIVNPCNR